MPDSTPPRAKRESGDFRLELSDEGIWLVFGDGKYPHDPPRPATEVEAALWERCQGQPPGEPSCDEKINHWIARHREACEQLDQMREELRRAEPVLVAADRIREAYEAMMEGRDVGRLAEWERPTDA